MACRAGGADVRLGPLDVDAALVLLAVDASPLPPRRIALLRLPQLAVRFRYDPAFQDQAHAWITHFDHHTQRGGGLT